MKTLTQEQSAERIACLRAQVQAGVYDVPSEAVAARILQRVLTPEQERERNSNKRQGIRNAPQPVRSPRPRRFWDWKRLLEVTPKPAKLPAPGHLGMSFAEPSRARLRRLRHLGSAAVAVGYSLILGTLFVGERLPLPGLVAGIMGGGLLWASLKWRWRC